MTIQTEAWLLQCFIMRLQTVFIHIALLKAGSSFGLVLKTIFITCATGHLHALYEHYAHYRYYHPPCMSQDGLESLQAPLSQGKELFSNCFPSTVFFCCPHSPSGLSNPFLHSDFLAELLVQEGLLSDMTVTSAWV